MLDLPAPLIPTKTLTRSSKVSSSCEKPLKFFSHSFWTLISILRWCSPQPISAYFPVLSRCLVKAIFMPLKKSTQVGVHHSPLGTCYCLPLVEVKPSNKSGLICPQVSIMMLVLCQKKVVFTKILAINQSPLAPPPHSPGGER